MDARRSPGSGIVGLGHAQPRRVVTNGDLAAVVDTSDEWIRSRTGIVTRHVAGDDETVPSLALDAARHALDHAGVAACDVDLVIVASTTAEQRSPNVAGTVSAGLDLTAPAVIDINVACSGFVHALALADLAIRGGSATRALVIGSEKLTAFTDMADRTTCVLTADGAGAVVVEGSAEPRIGPVAWGSAPELATIVRIQPPTNLFAQDGRAVYRWALSKGAGHARRAIDLAGLHTDDIGVLITHQANLRIIEPLAEHLGLTDRVVVTDVVDSGNTSAASIPLGFSRWWHTGRLPADTWALLFGFGGGFAFASQVVKTPATPPA
jgi:3-oxoacyl-[acyl-carrier-protein] synthase III